MRFSRGRIGTSHKRAWTTVLGAVCTFAAVPLACGPSTMMVVPDAESFGDAGTEGDRADGDAPENTTRPVWTEAELRTIRSFAPSALPKRSDTTNKFAFDVGAAVFGKKLFFTPLFAGKLLDGDNNGAPTTLGNKGESAKVSCAGCHQPEAQFSDRRTLGRQISLGSGWVLRKSPSLLDVNEVPVLMWDGRRDALFNQVFGPLESPLEMNSSRLFVAQQVFRLFRAEYEAIFGPMPPLGDPARFPPLSNDTTGCVPAGPAPKDPCDGTTRGMPGDKSVYDALPPQDQELVTRVVVNVGKAIGAYERQLSCGPSRFDAWVNLGQPLTPSEERGAQLFVGKAGCATCHGGPYFSDHKFYNVGLLPQTVAVVFRDVGDRGASVGLAKALVDPLNSKGIFSDGDDQRLPASVAPEMEGAFRTPMLRCVNKRPSFMHTGHMRSLQEVVEFFNRGGDRGGFPGVSVLTPLNLSDEEVKDVVHFMEALEGVGPSPEWLKP